MTSALWLDDDDVQRALGAFDPVTPVVQELLALAGRELQPCAGADGVEHAVVVRDAGEKYVLPLRAMRAVYRACLAAAAARRLMGPSIATVCVVAPRYAATAHLRLIAKYVRDAAHVAVCVTDGPAGQGVEQWVMDELFMTGVNLTIGTDVGEALFGANLIVIDALDAEVRIEQISAGAVIVNASGRDLPGAVVDAVVVIYVEDVRSPDGNVPRDLARRNRLTGPGYTGATRAYRRTPPVCDLRALLRADDGVRPHVSGVVLVEIRGAEAAGEALALHTGRAARSLGLGRRIDDSRSDTPPNKYGE
ncbi:hypothetical protein Pth03_27890 [Planotetraspora thailandica]|uniref:Ornithine cyclodeaminase n=1 Tax=Planotetraspora thailandica TaxID=487172 RepID=A0A8J3V1A5_9ACTN|nr:hypothetical protein [Planotetraspora thailandica]GII54400.1 hypothetical protein Pth03_27890 [Planotetraspora thailandica]